MLAKGGCPTFRVSSTIGAMVQQFFGIHPFFEIAESDVDNPQYICILILVLNAAKYSTISPLLEPQTLKYYLYLRGTMPSFVIELCLPDENGITIVRPSVVPESLEFLVNIVNNLNRNDNTNRVQANLLQSAKEHLVRLSDMDSTVSGTAHFTSLYIGAQLLMSQILENGFWSNFANLATQQSNNLETNIEELLHNSLKLQYLFVGLNSAEFCAVEQLRLRALGLTLVYIVKVSKASALAPSHYFLSAVEDMQRELANTNLQSYNFTSLLFRELATVEEPKPGTVERILLPF